MPSRNPQLLTIAHSKLRAALSPTTDRIEMSYIGG
jgi:hypothetical protein